MQQPKNREVMSLPSETRKRTAELAESAASIQGLLRVLCALRGCFTRFRDRRRSRFSIRARRRADLQIESVRRRRVVALVARRVDVAAPAGVDSGGQPALLELGLDLIGIERGDAEGDVTDRGAARRRRGAGSAAAAAAISATDDDAADVADLALILTALVGPGLPPEERGVERHGLLVVRHLV